MRHILFLLFMAFTLQAIAQYPATGNKMRLGWQTTGDGLVYRGAIGDTATLDPSGINNAWMLLDTANGNLYAYRVKAWRLVSGGGGSVSDTLTGEVKGPLDSTYIDTVANIIFTTTTDTMVGVGELEYNDTQGGLIQGLKGGNVTNVIGQQIHQRVTNATGAPLTKGTAVFLHGSQGNRITVRKALATVDSTSANTFGIVAESIADNQSGYVITEGLITNMNTNALTEGAAVYLSPTVAGELTTTKPQAPQHTVYIGVCVKQNAGSGELFVKIRNGQELDELHDVRITSPDSSASLYFNKSESVWRDTTPAALKSDISGTTNRLAMFTGANTVGNSNAFQDANGNIGIGATPSGTAQILDLYRASASLYPLLRGNSTAQDYAWTFSDGTNTAYAGMMGGTVTGSIGTGGYSIYLPSGSGSPITFSTNATERMRITSAGIVAMLNSNVGIGTTTPTAKLHINNPSSTTPALNIVSNSNVIGSTNDAVSINMQPGQVNQNNTGVRVFNTITGTSAEGNNTGIAVSLNARNSSYGVYSAVSKNWGGSSLFGEAIGVYGSATTDSPAGFSYGGYFKNDTTQGTGFGVFVQTTTPKGSGTVTPLAIQHNSTELMRVQSSGNVGIATSSPSRPLHVAGTTAIRIPVGTTSDRGTSANGDIRYNTTNANFEWYSGTGWREPVNAARSPAAALANRFSKFDANGLLDTSAVLVQANGRIGIWNSSPAASDSVLTVTGGIYTTNGVRVNNGISNFLLTPSGSVPTEIATLGLTHTATSAESSPGGIVALALTAQTPSTSFTYASQGINAARIRAFHNASSTLVQLNGVNLTSRNLGAGTVTLANGGNFVVGNSGASATGLITNARGGTFTLENAARSRITNLYGAYFILTNANDTAGSIGNIYGTYLEPITGGSAAVSVTNLYGYYIPSGWSAKATNKWSFYADDANAPLYSAGKIGAGVTTPTAVLHLKAGTASANTAPLKFTSGTNLTTPEAGAVEWNGTNVFVTNSSATRQTVNQGLTNSATMDFPNTDAQESSDLNITVTGASDGDVVSLGVSNAAMSANTCYTAWVSATNTVTIRFNNYSSIAVNPAQGNFKVFVTKF